MKIKLVFILITLYSISFSQSHQVDKYISIALSKNPELKSAGLRIEMYNKKYLQMNSLDPLSIGVEFFQIPANSINIFSTMEYDYFIQQMFPFPGKIRARAKPEEIASEMAGHEHKQAIKKVTKEVKQIFYELYMIQKKKEIIIDNLKFLDLLKNTIQNSFALGKVYQEDLSKAEIEFYKLLEDSISNAGEQKRMEVMFRSLLNENNDFKFENIGEFTLSKVDSKKMQVSEDLLNNRPDISAMRLKILMNEAESESAKKEYLPDFMVRVMYKQMKMDFPDYWSVMFSATLPFLPWSKPMIESKIEETEIGIEMEKSNFEQMKLMARSEYYSSLIRLKEYQDKIELYLKNIIPVAERSLNATLSSYRNGQMNIMMVIDNFRMLKMFRMEYYMLIANYEKTIAELEYNLGNNLIIFK